MTSRLQHIPETMSALIVTEPGPRPGVQVTSRPTPVPDADEALVRVATCGFCHHDRLVMDGTLRRGVAPGVALGHEITGSVAALGENVTDLQIGDRVVSLLTAACGRCQPCQSGYEHRCQIGAGIGHGRDGGFAEYLALPAASLVVVPRDIPTSQAALLACPSGVALEALEATAVQSGEMVVVTGAGGGLGTSAVQLAANLGATVIAITSSPGKKPGLEALGATHVMETDPDLDFSEIVMALTDDAGADVVIDTVGPPLWPSTLRCLGQRGRLALLGDLTGQTVPLRLAEVIFRDLRIVGHSGVSRSTLQRVVSMASRGVLQPVVAHTLPMTPNGLMQAWQLVAGQPPLGRVVLLRED